MDQQSGRSVRHAAVAAWRSLLGAVTLPVRGDGLAAVLGGTLCAVCRRWQGQALCAECLGRFARPRLRCVRCALALPEAAAHDEPGTCEDGPSLAAAARRSCGACLTRPPPQSASVAAFDYVYPWAGLLARFKFHGAVDLAGPLARALATALDQAPVLPDVDLVLPVPLARARLRERGYNQAWELARRVARRRGLRADATLIERVRNTPHQLALPRAARAANVQSAFVLAPRGQAQLAGRRVALVDDVMTTGATLAEAAGVLLRGGAAEVQCWVVARTPLDDSLASTDAAGVAIRPERATR